MPPGGSELIFVSMVYMPNSWSEVATKLATLPPFAQGLDVYNLVYTFARAIVSRDPVLLNMVNRDPATGRLVLPPMMEPIYGHRHSPLQFWESQDGIMMKKLASALRAKFRVKRPFFIEHLTAADWWIDFCNAVDRHSMNSRSVSNYQSPRPFQILTLHSASQLGHR